MDRDAIDESQFTGWIAWAAELGLHLDFNATLFSHPLAEDGYTLAHRDTAVRSFWIEHARRTRRIAAAMGRAQCDAALLDADARSDDFARLALLEAEKTLPWSAVWDEYCRRSEVPDDRALIASVEGYERRVLSKRR